ncbi:replication-relaxation family protein [Amycolatopsis sp. H20-H5]|uniref:replication-relaxation family protein n=1 Tax=Amycolatopsis sp. H20-H5 TaxID=3046309 RepID=UPI002DB8445A|nr:replication-relaxation family protein [Amycolatopsis sp. H20-H5]MEC3979635.1 replication-relaxation family protein [Amycolatopsis sp. H20-H5]
MNPTDTASLLMRLSERDVAILESLRAHRLLTTVHIRRLHFAIGHATIPAASGATLRVLVRLESHNLVTRLARRIGGVRAGSSGICWQLGATGERLLRTMHGQKQRRRYIEPSLAFTAHTLAVAELAVRLAELRDRQTIEVISIQTEPSCWRSFVGPHGSLEWLKPDLYAVTASGDYEDHWFLEADLATEHPPVVVRKAKIYQRYAATGAHQARHGLFPAVVWIVPDTARQETLQAALSADSAIQHELFRVVTVEEFDQLIASGGPDPPTARG